MKPSVSYIVPVHNCERYLAKCLESVLNQTVPAQEVIVVDDGSTDGSAAVTAAFGDRVRYLHQEHSGTSAARNQGIRQARGEFVAFLDADDLIQPTKLAVQLARFEARPELQFSDAYLRNFWSPDIPEADRWKQPRSRFTHSETPRGHSIITWLLRRDLFDRIGEFDESMALGEDQDWYERMRTSGAVCETLDRIVSLRRLHGANLTLVRYEEYLSSIVRAQRLRVARMRDVS